VRRSTQRVLVGVEIREERGTRLKTTTLKGRVSSDLKEEVIEVFNMDISRGQDESDGIVGGKRVKRRKKEKSVEINSKVKNSTRESRVGKTA